MGEPLAGAGHVGAGAIDGERRLGRAEHEVAAHAGREVQDDVDARATDALHHLAIERRIARALARLGVAHVDMRDGRTGPAAATAAVGDLAPA